MKGRMMPHAMRGSLLPLLGWLFWGSAAPAADRVDHTVYCELPQKYAEEIKIDYHNCDWSLNGQ